MRRATLTLALSITSSLVLTSCLKGPNYSRPKVDVPTDYHGPSSTVNADEAQSLGHAKWWSIFKDDALQKLIRTAIGQNYDLRIAASRVLEAHEAVTIARSDQVPTVSGGATLSGTRYRYFPDRSQTKNNIVELGLSFGWDVDFWGKYRRLTEAARADLMATDWARRGVVNGLVSSVAAAYFELRTLDLELEISRRTLASRQDSLDLTRALVNGGAAPLTDQRQAEQLVEAAALSIPNLERQVQQLENAINILLGRNPGAPIERGLVLAEQLAPEVPPPGIPSTLLDRRPDIAQAEQDLVAANARIGVARAAFFPDITLTGLGGVASSALGNLFRSNPKSWDYNASVMEPIFTRGRLKANLRQIEAQREQALLAYQQTIQQAFRDVSDGLIAYQKFRESRVHQERLLAAAKDAADLARTRYQGGATSYLEVLTNETNSFSAEIGLATALLNERLAVVQLYGALGGGWEQ
ncbi:MAG: efflux transporter outer membrane subunit [Bryobacteraceae bacterium]